MQIHFCSKISNHLFKIIYVMLHTHVIRTAISRLIYTDAFHYTIFVSLVCLLFFVFCFLKFGIALLSFLCCFKQKFLFPLALSIWNDRNNTFFPLE